MRLPQGCANLSEIFGKKLCTQTEAIAVTFPLKLN